jgi:hypothetical protein
MPTYFNSPEEILELEKMLQQKNVRDSVAQYETFADDVHDDKTIVCLF